VKVAIHNGLSSLSRSTPSALGEPTGDSRWFLGSCARRIVREGYRDGIKTGLKPVAFESQARTKRLQSSVVDNPW